MTGAGEAGVNPASGQPAGDPAAMAQEYGYCPFISNTAAVGQPRPSLAPSGGPASVDVAVMPLLSPCLGPRCALWFYTECSFKAMARDARLWGNKLDADKTGKP